ncbi:MAG: hypothetical protein HY791_12480 [Deltaproteobacteria bacterium]|nr:hypothetical protein [Deltaproteobacteria bacterium]
MLLLVLCAFVGTATSAADGEIVRRVENRAFSKQDRVLPRVGLAYWTRGDLRENPGIRIDASWYPSERFGLDLISATLFFSTLDASADDLRRIYGALPDSQRPIARVTAGPRFAFAYGKLLIEGLDVVVHMDASLALHLGAISTDVTTNFAFDLELAFQALFADRFVGFVSISAIGSYEARTRSSFDAGPMISGGLGIVL